MESMQQVECGWDWAAMVVQMVPWWWLTTAAGWGETATKPLPLPALAQFGNMSPALAGSSRCVGGLEEPPCFGCLPCPVSTCRLTEWVWSLSWLRSGTKGLQRGLAAGAARRRGINGATVLIGVETRVKIHAFIGALPSEARPAESLERHDMPTCARPQRDGNYVYLPDLAWPGLAGSGRGEWRGRVKMMED
ncbi:hypothetical protein PCL_04690 [Purpureocillium lilacinum]|uniref:Uncharacterized protein n=1 Tax=Purpureocillium lilacinum TaxID=33203 RepID=A0A2U3DX83_PURLI|nr:hypothetical protein Purlil1_10848 [Purpureocillium lilacinum]PWI66846.1 hypothetical protein PCL_04690 [Purpureocillium lilacinum]